MTLTGEATNLELSLTISTVALAAPTLSTLNDPVDVLFKNVGGNCTVGVLKVNTGLAGIGSTLTSSI